MFQMGSGGQLCGAPHRTDTEECQGGARQGQGVEELRFLQKLPQGGGQ